MSSSENASSSVLDLVTVQSEDDSQTVTNSSASSFSTAPVIFDVGIYKPNNFPPRFVAPDSVIKLLDESFDALLHQYKIAVKACQTKTTTLSELKNHVDKGSFPQDLDFKFNPFCNFLTLSPKPSERNLRPPTSTPVCNSNVDVCSAVSHTLRVILKLPTRVLNPSVSPQRTTKRSSSREMPGIPMLI